MSLTINQIDGTLTSIAFRLESAGLGDWAGVVRGLIGECGPRVRDPNAPKTAEPLEGQLHTPGDPWVYPNGHCIAGHDGRGVAMCGMAARSAEEGRANAYRLVHCWNNHDQLLAALKRLNNIAHYHDDFGPDGHAEFDAASKQAQVAIEQAEDHK